MENKNNVNTVNANEERNYSVYMHINLENLKLYVGITSQEPKDRWRNGHGYRTNPYLWNAINKAKQKAKDNKLDKDGWDKYFAHLILFENLTKGEAEAKEIELIAEYRSAERDRGYNIQHGGNANGKQSEESILKLRECKKGGNNPRAKAVYCGEMIFPTIRQCAEFYGVYNKTMTYWLKHTDKMPSKFIKLELRDATEEDVKNYHICTEESSEDNKVMVVRKHKAVYSDGMIFKNVTQCSKFYKVDHSTITHYLNKGVKTYSKTHSKFIKLGLRYATQDDINTYPPYIEEEQNQQD